MIGSIWDNDSSKRKALNWRISTKNWCFLEWKNHKTNALIMSSPSFDDEWSSVAFIAGHDIIWYGISLWSVWVSCPGFVLSQPLAHFQPTGLWRMWDLVRQPWCVEAVFSSGQNWCFISTILATNTKHNLTRSAMGKLIPYQPDPMQSPCFISYTSHNIQVPQNLIHLYPF